MTRLFLLIAFALALVPGAAHAECNDRIGQRGVALLIGVSEYRAPEQNPDGGSWGHLGNAVRDVDEVCAKLSEKGFATWIVRNPTFGDLDTAIADFKKAADAADYALVYYAGHGFEFRGQSYVVPVNAPRNTSLSTLRRDFVPLSRLVTAASASAKFGLLLLDACRTRDAVVNVLDADPTDDQPGQVNLVEVDGAVLFSTKLGKPALDAAPRDSRLSPFATAVLAGLDRPRELGDFYGAVHDEVAALTKDMPPDGPQLAVLYRASSEPLFLVAPPVTTAPIQMPPLARLATVDEPSLIREILREHTFTDLVTAANAGDPAAQYLVGYAYEFGVAVRRDLAEARTWLEKSAAQKHPGGLLELAYFLEHQTTEQARARALYEEAAASGYAKAQSHFASYLYNGSYDLPGTTAEQQRSTAIGLFRQSSAAGHVYATYWLALYAPPELSAPAETRLRQLAAEGDPAGVLWLCDFHVYRKEWADATEQCVRAASRGGATQGAGVAQAYLAGMYARGEGVDRSDEQAQYWAKLALTEPELETEIGTMAFQEIQDLAE